MRPRCPNCTNDGMFGSVRSPTCRRPGRTTRSSSSTQPRWCPASGSLVPASLSVTVTVRTEPGGRASSSGPTTGGRSSGRGGLLALRADRRRHPFPDPVRLPTEVGASRRARRSRRRAADLRLGDGVELRPPSDLARGGHQPGAPAQPGSGARHLGRRSCWGVDLSRSRAQTDLRGPWRGRSLETVVRALRSSSPTCRTARRGRGVRRRRHHPPIWSDQAGVRRHRCGDAPSCIGRGEGDPRSLTRAFNPASLNWAMAGLAATAALTADGLPSGKRPLRAAPDRQPDVGDLP